MVRIPAEKAATPVNGPRIRASPMAQPHPGHQPDRRRLGGEEEASHLRLLDVNGLLHLSPLLS